MGTYHIGALRDQEHENRGRRRERSLQSNELKSNKMNISIMCIVQTHFTISIATVGVDDSPCSGSTGTLLELRRPRFDPVVVKLRIVVSNGYFLVLFLL